MNGDYKDFCYFLYFLHNLKFYTQNWRLVLNYDNIIGFEQAPWLPMENKISVQPN